MKKTIIFSLFIIYSCNSINSNNKIESQKFDQEVENSEIVINIKEDIKQHENHLS